MAQKKNSTQAQGQKKAQKAQKGQVIMNTQKKAGQAAKAQQKAQKQTQEQKDRAQAVQFTRLNGNAREYCREYDRIVREAARAAKKAREDAKAAKEDITAAQAAGKAAQAARLQKAEDRRAEAAKADAAVYTARKNSAARLFFAEMTQGRLTARAAYEAYAGRADRPAVWQAACRELLSSCGLSLNYQQAETVTRLLSQAIGMREASASAVARTQADRGGTCGLACAVTFASFPRLFLSSFITIVDRACPDLIGTEYGAALLEQRQATRRAEAQKKEKELRAEIARLRKQAETAEARANAAQQKATEAAQKAAEAEAKAAK